MYCTPFSQMDSYQKLEEEEGCHFQTDDRCTIQSTSSENENKLFTPLRILKFIAKNKIGES